MYLSKYVRVDKNISLKKIKTFRIKHNKRINNIYLLCTTPDGRDLFEIIQGNDISVKYDKAFVLGISKNKEWLINEVIRLIDEIYNTKTLQYDSLKVQ